MPPVLVVGGGPVGMTAALLLAQYDVPSVILEASDQRDPIGSKALCMQRDVLDILERVGCGDVLVGEGVTWTVGRTYWRDHELFQITFPEIGDNHYPPFVNVGQDRTEFWLERRVAASPLVELRYGHHVVGLSQNGGGVVLDVATAGGEKQFSGSYAIGADGSRSTMRKLIDATFDGRSFDDKFLICDIRTDLGFANERRFFFDPDWNPDRQVLIHPQADSVWRIDWQVPPDFDIDAEQRNGGLDGRIGKIVGDAPYEIVWMSVYRFHQRIASAFQAERVFLAGDAAHIVSPFGARGLNSGIQDAENLAWKLGYVINKWAGTALLDTYAVERRAAAIDNLRVTGATMDFLVPPTEALWERRRRTLESAVGHPEARSMVDSGQLAEPFDYADSPLTTQGPGTGAVTPGMLMPDGPLDLEPPAGTTRLRQTFGTGFAVLTGDTHLSDADLPQQPPVRIHALADVDGDSTLSNVLELAPDRAVVIRPDGHIAGIVPANAESIRATVGRATATWSR